jgi:hypothetical protein
MRVPVDVWATSEEIECVVEYLHGNTTHRIISVELDWTPVADASAAGSVGPTRK